MGFIYTATYSPEDDKLRLYASTRLDEETYQRVKAAGFRWAPSQQLFFAVWNPDREDLLAELAGGIDDEDKSLVERAEERAERFDDYSSSRAEDATRARDAVAQLADGIPLGQPILVGHHSENRARKDAAKIENGMRKAVKMWETSQYWQSRAAGALRHAKYKERPDVRARRIKGLESEIRVMRARFTPDPKTRPQVWEGEEHVWCSPGGRGGSWVKSSRLPALEAHYSRWIQHNELRLEYERAMLAEAGGPVTSRWNFEVGGRVLYGSEWVTIIRINKDSAGNVASFRTNARYVSLVEVERVKDYQPPTEEQTEQVKKATKLPPLVNFRAPGCVEMTGAAWKEKTEYSCSAGVYTYAADGAHTWGRVNEGEKPIAYRQRSVLGRNYDSVPVFITDSKVIEPPTVKEEIPKLPAPVRDLPSVLAEPVYQRPEPTEFDAMRDALRTGKAVQAVAAPQLFPTPPDLARRMVDLAEDHIGTLAGRRILEPSAGTGNLIRAIHGATTGADCCRLVAVERYLPLVDLLNDRRNKTVYATDENFKVISADFLECNGDLGKFDAILMNPPFENADDIKHIQHAFTMLKPGGCLVAICAAGPRQQEKLKPITEILGGAWEELPDDTFREMGTSVHAVLMSVQLPK